ncbi:hypothetical protein C0J52_08772 [Blattella germanica]|nr:hypothetical protein C0J52_08772 [Blattella germanica]
MVHKQQELTSQLQMQTSRRWNKGSQPSELKLLLWNIEGFKGAIPYIPQDVTDEYDITITTETFLKEPADIQTFYSFHTFAAQTAGRPAGGREGRSVKQQKGLWSSTISPIRKHIPIVTELIL